MDLETFGRLVEFARDYGLGTMLLVLVLAVVLVLGRQLIAKGFSVHVDVGRKGQRP